MKDEDPNQLDLFGTRLDYLVWRVVSKAARNRPGRRERGDQRSTLPVKPIIEGRRLVGDKRRVEKFDNDQSADSGDDGCGGHKTPMVNDPHD